jgi:hypothetical protein
LCKSKKPWEIEWRRKFWVILIIKSALDTVGQADMDGQAQNMKVNQ